MRPDNLCFNRSTTGGTDGGQLFITGEGLDGVVIVYPYHTPEVAETVLAGHAPGAMAASGAFLFVASPLAGDGEHFANRYAQGDRRWCRWAAIRDSWR